MKKLIFFAVIIFPLLAACSSLVLSPVNYAWPVESVLTADADGNVEVERYSFSFNIKPVMLAEFNDTTNLDSKQIRIIRDSAGLYFVTGKGFKNVYIFESDDKALSLSDKIAVSEIAFQRPVLNQRDTHIELLDGNNKYELTNNGITGE